MEIFEQYFYDEEQFERRLGSDIVELLDQKIQIFRYNYGEIGYGVTLPGDMHQIESIYLHDSASSHRTLVERVNIGEVVGIKSGSLLNNLSSVPVYHVRDNKIYFHPASSHTNSLFSSPSGGYSYQLIVTRKPKKANWGYVVVNDKPLYNSNTSTDFELHPSEESELVYRILAFTGIAIEKPQLTQVAVGLEGAKQQQEKQ